MKYKMEKNCMMIYGINNTKTISNARKVGGDYFRLIYVRRSKLYLKDYLVQFIPEEYWILKSTDKFKFVSVEEIKEFKYASYVFFKKELYSKKYIQEWLDFIYVDLEIKIYFLIKPFPPEYIKKMIKVIDEI